MSAVVADASVFIALVQIHELPLLEALFGDVTIPRAVAGEVAPSVPSLPAWVETRVLRRPLPPRIVAASLDAGEAEALALALEIEAELVILDDLPARRLAEAMGLAIIGTAGVLFMANSTG